MKGSELRYDWNSVDRLLKDEYHDFNHYNKSDPFDELLFIICSVKTAEKSYKSLFKSVRAKFNNNESFLTASISEISEPLKNGGLSLQKANYIKGICNSISNKFGAVSLSGLKVMDDTKVERFLMSLPGVGKKVARCVMMYSLDRKVFPVDTHCWRICRRLGVVRRTRPDGSCSPKDMDRLQQKIPSNLRYPLHINLVSHGRKICKATNPLCNNCKIIDFCRQINVK